MNNFTSEQQLFEHLRPALIARYKEFKRIGFDIKPIVIWNYLKKSKWESAENLLMYEIVSDILNVDCYKVDDFRKKESM